MSQSTIFQLCRDGSSWVVPVLSKDKCVLLKDRVLTEMGKQNSRSFPGLISFFQGLHFFPILYKTTQQNANFSAGNVEVIKTRTAAQIE